MKNIVIFLFLIAIKVNAQNIEGNIKNLKNNEIVLSCFEGLTQKQLAKTTTDSIGNFKINYPKSYIGGGLLQIKGVSSLIVLLNQESFAIRWDNTQDFNTLQFIASPENDFFAKGIIVNQEAEQKLAGINYLIPRYEKENTAKDLLKNLMAEKALQAIQFSTYIERLPNDVYAKQYLMQRKILQDLQSSQQKEKYSSALQEQFLQLHLDQYNWEHSGLIKEVLDLVLENIVFQPSAADRFDQYQKISDKLIKEEKATPLLFNEISEYLFKYFEKYSFSKEAAYLALKILGEDKCIADTKRISLFEQYRKMAVGNIAMDLTFVNSNAVYKKLSEIKTKYKVVVFGASWCEECKKEIPQLSEYAATFKTKYDTSIVLVSLDTDKNEYRKFMSENPNFIFSCDFKMWEGSNVKNYYVNASPTLFILNDTNKIVAKPTSAIDCATWLFKNDR